MLSPTLFVCFINNIIQHVPEGVEVSLFADDLALWVQDNDLQRAVELTQRALVVLEQWVAKWKLQISIEKTDVVVFTNDTYEAKFRPNLRLCGERLGFNETPTFLGVTFDRQLTFNAHIKKIKRKAKSRIHCTQALSGIDWGCCRDDLRLIYLVYVRSAVEYAAPAWAPFVSKSQMNSLEVSQNAAARVITR